MSEFYEASSQYVVTDYCAMLIPLEFGKSAEESVADAADLVGVEGYRELITLYTTMFSDLRFDIHDIVAEGDIVCSRWTSVGTHDGEVLGIRPTGNLLKRTGVSWQRIENGKFAETWVERDGLGLARDIGAVPPR